MNNASSAYRVLGHAGLSPAPPSRQPCDQLWQGQTPLGFSDLSEDEALLIWLARRWHDGVADRAAIEQILREDLAADHYAAVLIYIFALLEDLPAPSALPAPGYPLVTPEECELLNLLGAPSNQLHHVPSTLTACLAALDAAGIMIRASHAIPTSGIDWLAARIDYGHPFAGKLYASY